MVSLIKTPYCNTNPPVTIYALLSNFQISWFTRFFAPLRPADFHPRPAPPRPARKSFAPHISGTRHNWCPDVPETKGIMSWAAIKQYQTILCHSCPPNQGLNKVLKEFNTSKRNLDLKWKENLSKSAKFRTSTWGLHIAMLPKFQPQCEDSILPYCQIALLPYCHITILPYC